MTNLKTIQEVAERLRKKVPWVRAHSNGSRQPTLRRVKLGKGYVFDDSDVDEFIDACRETAKPINKK